MLPRRLRNTTLRPQLPIIPVEAALRTIRVVVEEIVVEGATLVLPAATTEGTAGNRLTIW
jgi:hypothetical protein